MTHIITLSITQSALTHHPHLSRLPRLCVAESIRWWRLALDVKLSIVASLRFIDIPCARQATASAKVKWTEVIVPSSTRAAEVPACLDEGIHVLDMHSSTRPVLASICDSPNQYAHYL